MKIQNEWIKSASHVEFDIKTPNTNKNSIDIGNGLWILYIIHRSMSVYYMYSIFTITVTSYQYICKPYRIAYSQLISGNIYVYCEKSYLWIWIFIHRYQLLHFVSFEFFMAYQNRCGAVWLSYTDWLKSNRWKFVQSPSSLFAHRIRKIMKMFHQKYPTNYA